MHLASVSGLVQEISLQLLTASFVLAAGNTQSRAKLSHNKSRLKSSTAEPLSLFTAREVTVQ